MIEVSLILPDIRSSLNVGSIFRTAEIFAVKKIYICGYTPYPAIKADKRLPHVAKKLDSQIRKTALGTEKLVNFAVYPTAIEAIATAKKDGNTIFALEQTTTSTLLEDARFSGKVAFILGNEVDGIDPKTLNQVDGIIEISQLGSKESLNVASSCAILLYDICINKQKK